MAVHNNKQLLLPIKLTIPNKQIINTNSSNSIKINIYHK